LLCCPIAVLPSQFWDCVRELTLAGRLALQHFRGHTVTTLLSEKTHCKEAEEHPPTNLVKLRFMLQEIEVLEASTRRIRPQRAPTNVTKLQSSYLSHSTAWHRPVARTSTTEEKIKAPRHGQDQGTRESSNITAA